MVLANTMKTQAIASAKMNLDKVDAMILVHLLRADLVAESFVRLSDVIKKRVLVRQGFL